MTEDKGRFQKKFSMADARDAGLLNTECVTRQAVFTLVTRGRRFDVGVTILH